MALLPPQILHTLVGEYTPHRGEARQCDVQQITPRCTMQAMMVGVSRQLASNANKTSGGREWLAQLPAIVRELKDRWKLALGETFDGDDVSCSWVAQVRQANGAAAVLKVGWPHMEGAHEIHGLRFWNGDPTVRLLDADENLNAMLLERCEPGTVLRSLEEHRQDRVIAGLLQRLWRVPSSPHPFRPLSELMAHWSQHTIADRARWPDAGLVRAGLGLFADLPNWSQPVLLATDLHAGNVLRAEREPWLVIDPKPFIGDPAYDATQHLLNCTARVRSNPHDTIRAFADMLEVDRERVRLWLFARVAAEPQDEWTEERIALALAIG